VTPDNDYQGSYAVNGWLYWSRTQNPEVLDPEKSFGVESAIRVPPRTPVFADSVWCFVAPSATDVPSRDLFEGGNDPNASMQRVTIARHGLSNPKSAPRALSPGADLPGSITIVFYDGHAESVRLENLWLLDWHKDYVAPATRPR
jgi:hypothetical protein